jgi:hypothetical protein
MAAKAITALLSGYFNAKDAPNYRPLREFVTELRDLSDAEKLELAEGICEVTGDTIKVA